ncbi:peptidase M1 family aminopeptidase (macronuclear) [Tetrahymena thermophila SB210]|uniref:Peptidase M1 family aminopeptidase n=1 Tax=Tetrahymena thermophila (strain SB210) TaxID=312017 RepID=I7M9R4_TETTS|nr:peptidase M1 family aminopeptidase [Tetrahymena thermophila SB210]EAS02663.2 peptidase M1 family aminopeptidase [Tetrahymena thermophila SB210]|eukprot:XP_001022908.2 peptidase M1 family aminopeptidase [Tetrahymena thermophila SB210]
MYRKMIHKIQQSKSLQFKLGATLFTTAIGLSYAYYKYRKESLNNLKKQNTPKVKDNYNSVDELSLSNIDKVKCLHYDLILYISFDKKSIEGSVNYHFEATQKTRKVYLDIRNIKIKNIIMDGQKLEYTILSIDKTKSFGEQLQIFLPQKYEQGSKFELTIQYETIQSKHSGLNWLNPSQTEGKVHPYLFTQSEPYWNRTIFPCQDSPAIKSTYTAQLHVTQPLKAYCSAKLISKSETEHETIMNFKQDIPIPSYLFALVAGNLEERKTSDRTSVISEPEVIEKYTKELEDMEVQLKTLEEIITPYEWEEYKIVVLPASFPYGGMENPLLTFASPSIIVGDKSATDVVIHEMAHSWSGNLFTCKNWREVWLNEGWTGYFECEAIRKLHGEEEYQVKFSMLDNELKNSIDKIGHHHSYTTLNPIIDLSNPDESFVGVPYLRGLQFLTHLQNFLGKNEFSKFTRSFIEKFKYKSVDTQDFKESFKEFFGEQIYTQIDWNAWITKPGYPPQVFAINCQGVEKPKQAALRFLNESNISKQEWDTFSVQQKIIFLQEVNKKDKLTQDKVKLLDENLELFNLVNPEVYTKWFVVALVAKYDPIIPYVKKHLSQYGRMKFVREIYKLLDEYNHDLAVEVFKQNEELYYGFCHSLVKSDLKL